MLVKIKFGLLAGLLIAFIVVTACSEPKTDETLSQSPEQTETPTVEIVTLKELPLEKEEMTESFLYAQKDAFITAKIDGILKEVYLDLGDEVKLGDTLARIEDELLSLEFRLAQNLCEQAQEDFKRSQILYDKKLISESEYEHTKLKYKQADIEEQLALERLRHSRLIAPFSGVVVSQWARVGQVVRAGDSLFHLTEISPLYSRAILSEEELTRLKTEGKVRILPKYGIRKSAWGKIIKRSPVVEPVSGTVELIIEIDSRYSFLKPGMAVDLFLKENSPSVSLAVPRTLFSPAMDLSAEDTTSIYIYSGGKALRKVVELRGGSDSLWAISGGPKAGDSLIVSYSGKLKDGQEVKLLQTTPSSKK